MVMLLITIAVLGYRRGSNPGPVSQTSTEPVVVAAVVAAEPPPEALTNLPETPVAEETELTNQPAAKTATPLPDNFAAEFKNCFPERSTANSASEFANALLNSADLQSREMTLENLHVSDGSGEHRLNLFGHGSMAEVRNFEVDAEGLPLPTGRPQMLNKEAAETVKQDFLRRGKLIYQQRKEVVMLNDGLRGEIEWQDEKVRDIMFFRSDRSFFCREGLCQCRRQAQAPAQTH